MIKPLNDFVLLECYDEQKIGDIYIASSKDEKRTNKARIVSLGIGKLIDNKRVPIALEVGDIVIYKEYATLECYDGNKKYLLIQEEDIIATIK